jgi:hypothetical protein
MFEEQEYSYLMFYYKELVGVLGTGLHFKESSWYFETGIDRVLNCVQ